MDAAAVRKVVSRVQAALRKANRALRAAERLPEDLAPAAYAADAVRRDLEAAARDLGGISAADEIERYVAALRERVEPALEDAAARLAAEVARRLSPEGAVTGQLPELRWGLLRLEFRLAGPRRGVVVWYGPRISTLARAPADADRIAEATREARAALDRSPLDPVAFVAELKEAYEAVRRRRGAEPGQPVPIVEALRELALARQSPAFRADPVREHFRSYGRVQFSYDLYRVGPRGEIALGVAAHAQTRRPEDHLWVPTSPSGDGTHFASLAIRSR